MMTLRPLRDPFGVMANQNQHSYTKADMPNAWVNASRLAFFTSAFEGTAVMAGLRLRRNRIAFTRRLCKSGKAIPITTVTRCSCRYRSCRSSIEGAP